MPHPPPTAPAARPQIAWRDIVALAWVAVFLTVFFAQELPNNHVRRTDLAAAWWSSGVVARQPLPFELLDALDPPREADSVPGGLSYLGQRVPLWTVAALMAAGAWGLGVMLLACLEPLPLDRWERQYFRLLLGLSGLSLLTLGLGLCGVLGRGVFVAGHLVLLALGLWRGRFSEGERFREASLSGRSRAWWWIGAAPFLMAMLFGAVSPPTDFDAKAYHLGGPKEWFLCGRIEFLDHNVYTSFPFLTEMLLLDGMVVQGDWYWGGVAGQAVLMLFAPITALGLWCFGRRYWSHMAGSVAAVVYLSTPWTYRLAIIPYVEGGQAAYLFGAFYALQLFRTESESRTWRWALLAGLLAGSAMACKYPALLNVVLPLGVWAVVSMWRRSASKRWWHGLRVGAAYGLGVLLAVGPWLLKNAVETGNPVYPLAYRLFGGRALDAAWAERFGTAHSKHFEATITQEAYALLVKGVFDVAAVNDWQSPLIFAFAPLAFLWPGDRRPSRAAWLYLVWVFLAWWLFMHYIDRFWTPLLPLGALLAGVGVAALQSTWSRRVAGTVVAGGCTFNLAFCVTGLGGYNAGLTDLAAARRIAEQTSPAVAWLNQQFRGGALPAGSRVLCVGEAQLFDAEFPYVYNTVFNRSVFEAWCTTPAGWRSADEIRGVFAAHGITHVLVNWNEVLRYRTNSYGYTDVVHPQAFERLQQMGVLRSPLSLPASLQLRPVRSLSEFERDYVRRWAPPLIVPCGDEECFVATQVFPVTNPDDQGRGGR